MPSQHEQVAALRTLCVPSVSPSLAVEAVFYSSTSDRWVLRHFRRGGLIGKFISDLYFWRGAEQTRAFREWRLLYELRAKTFPVPAPVATRYVRSGLFYRADLITEALPPGRTLAQAIVGTNLVDHVWRKIGAAIARLHKAGVHHADLNSQHLLAKVGRCFAGLRPGRFARAGLGATGVIETATFAQQINRRVRMCALVSESGAS